MSTAKRNAVKTVLAIAVDVNYQGQITGVDAPAGTVHLTLMKFVSLVSRHRWRAHIRSTGIGILGKPVQLLRLALENKSGSAVLVSYPKSGRTWFRYILANYFSLLYDLKIDVTLQNCFEVIPNLDYDPVRGIPAFKSHNWPASVPKVYVSHREFSTMLFGRRRIIFIVRDPRDVMVSAYFHETRHKRRFSGGMMAFVTDKDRGLQALVRYLNGWARGLQSCENIVISYEGLSRNAASETARVLRFLGCPIDSSALKAAVEAASFEAMRDSEITGGIPGHDYDRTNTESLRMRRGKAHGFADYLSPEEISFIDDHLARSLSPDAKAMVQRSTNS